MLDGNPLKGEEERSLGHLSFSLGIAKQRFLNRIPTKLALVKGGTNLIRDWGKQRVTRPNAQWVLSAAGGLGRWCSVPLTGDRGRAACPKPEWTSQSGRQVPAAKADPFSRSRPVYPPSEQGKVAVWEPYPCLIGQGLCPQSPPTVALGLWGLALNSKAGLWRGREKESWIFNFWVCVVL